MAALNKELDPRFAKAFGVFAGIITLALLYFYFAALGKLVPIHSDRAGPIVYAAAILEGNWGLRDWNLTTYGYYNEIPFYIIAVRIVGVTTDVMRLVPAFILAINTMLLVALIWKHRSIDKYWILVPVLIFLVLPSSGAHVQLLSGANHHVTLMSILIAALLLGTTFATPFRTGRAFSLLLLSAIATCSDVAFAYIFVVSVALTTLITYGNQKENLRLASVGTLLPLLLGSVAGRAVESLQASLGLASSGGAGSPVFESLFRIGPKLTYQFIDWLNFFGANFFDRPVGILSLSSIALAIGVFMWVLTSRDALQRKHGAIDTLCAMLLLVAVFVATLSRRGDSYDNARFLLPGFFGAIFLISRYLQSRRGRLTSVLTCMALLGSLAVSYSYFSTNRFLISGDQYGRRLEGPIRELQTRNLVAGYADYWSCHLLKVASGDQLQLIPVHADRNGNMIPMFWSADAKWIRNRKGRFAVFSGEYFGEPSRGEQSRDKLVATAISHWGEPAELVESEGLVILIWDSERQFQKENLPPGLR